MVNGNFPDYRGGYLYPPPGPSSIHPDSGKRERTKFSDYQLKQLEKVFDKHQYPQGQQREHLAVTLGLTETKVQVWFKNRRAKARANKKYEELRQQTAASLANNNTKCANFPSNSTSGSFNVKEEHPTEPGGTEDENEGDLKSASAKISATKALPSFPASMPMIPWPPALDSDFKIEPPPENSLMTTSTGTNTLPPTCSHGTTVSMPSPLNPRSKSFPDSDFLSGMTSTLNPLQPPVQTGWMPSYTNMFNMTPTNYHFANHANPYYSASAYDFYNHAAYYAPGSAFRDQKFP
ncbi:homeobox domain-containing protein [Ditylenchus destructor]|uniref:Homeobox domain-containing protein n=1 Tax=Ditylenchus destructor TaxID=166010 RepID=A0AAD4MWY7_9BILA|nr:homeobox domain-containing protein [Ditylenchus destructor]